ncbi:MAG: hypothetical protein WCI49_15365, partial [Ferruginibacter sp.]
MTGLRTDIVRQIVISGVLLLTSCGILAQDSIRTCKVEMVSLAGIYKGECENGFANGEGEAIGVHRYKG